MVNGNVQPIEISSRWLLAVYGIIPVLVGVVCIDMLFFSKSLLPYMGFESMFLPLYLLLFELPHIIASLLGFADRDYRRHYYWHLYIGLPLLLGAMYLLFQYNQLWAIFLYFVATMYHVIKQQTGIALILGTPRSSTFQIWTYTAIVATGLTYALIVLADAVSTNILSLAQPVIYLLLFVSLGAGMWQWRQTKTASGSWYVLATTAMLLASFGMLLLGYLFFAFFVIRFVHDVTAFIFYSAHEHNRNFETFQNPLYALCRHIPVPIFVLVPVISIGGAYAIRTLTDGTALAWLVVIGLGFVHYYLESVMWKRDSPHREYIRITR